MREPAVPADTLPGLCVIAVDGGAVGQNWRVIGGAGDALGSSQPTMREESSRSSSLRGVGSGAHVCHRDLVEYLGSDELAGASGEASHSVRAESPLPVHRLTRLRSGPRRGGVHRVSKWCKRRFARCNEHSVVADGNGDAGVQVGPSNRSTSPGMAEDISVGGAW